MRSPANTSKAPGQTDCGDRPVSLCTDRVIFHFDRAVELGYEVSLTLDNSIKINGRCIPSSDRAQPLLADTVIGELIGDLGGFTVICSTTGLELLFAPQRLRIHLQSGSGAGSPPWKFHLTDMLVDYTASSTASSSTNPCLPRCVESVSTLQVQAYNPDEDATAAHTSATALEESHEESHTTIEPEPVERPPWWQKKYRAAVLSNSWIQRVGSEGRSPHPADASVDNHQTLPSIPKHNTTLPCTLPSPTHTRPSQSAVLRARPDSHKS
eukprot:1178111-Prorocentrum_minimum.AAC.4